MFSKKNFNVNFCISLKTFIKIEFKNAENRLVPIYLSEISPNSLRGQTGVIHQLFATIGIFSAQLLGLRQILGMKTIPTRFRKNQSTKANGIF